MNKLMIAAICLATAGYVSAQEAEAAPAGEAVAVDGGVQALEEAQESEPAPASEDSPTAADILQKQMEAKGWNEGWDEGKGRIIVVASADFNIKDPKNEPDRLFLLREAAVKRAVLQAKANVIEMINSQMSASEKFDMPGTDINKQLGAESEKVQQAMADSLELLNAKAPNDQVVKLKAIEAMEKMANGQATKIIIPSEMQGLVGMASGLVEAVKEK